MLAYFRYFILLSLFLIAGVAYMLGIYLQDKATKHFIISPDIKEARFFSDLVESKLVCHYTNIFRDESTVATPEKDKFKRLAGALLGFMPHDKVTLYGRQGVDILSSNNDEIIPLHTEGDHSIREALNGQEHASLVTSGTYEQTSPQTQIRKYHTRIIMSLHGGACGSAVETDIVGAIEFFFDSGELRKKIYHFRFFVIAGVMGMGILLYAVLLLSSRKHERVINKQHEEKMQLERAKAIAENKSREKSMFLANITHELRTPLNAIIGFSEILKEGAIIPGENKYAEYVKDIHSAGVHLLGLINDILDYSKAEASKLEIDIVDMDLRKLAMNCLRLVEPKAAEADLRLIADIPKHHMIMKGDPKRIKQVILNLLSNAVKFTPAGGEVTLSIVEEFTDEMIEITIVDTGIGIPQKQISKALSPFGQVESSMSKQEGTGLGLPLTKKLTEIMGGEFIFQSEKDLGTSITLRFPYQHVNTEKQTIDF